jgi:hypothetical protein
MAQKPKLQAIDSGEITSDQEIMNKMREILQVDCKIIHSTPRNSKADSQSVSACEKSSARSGLAISLKSYKRGDLGSAGKEYSQASTPGKNYPSPGKFGITPFPPDEFTTYENNFGPPANSLSNIKIDFRLETKFNLATPQKTKHSTIHPNLDCPQIFDQISISQRYGSDSGSNIGMFSGQDSDQPKIIDLGTSTRRGIFITSDSNQGKSPPKNPASPEISVDKYLEFLKCNSDQANYLEDTLQRS